MPRDLSTDKTTVGDIMTSPVTTLGVDVEMGEARKLMLDIRGSALPIVNSHNQPVGMLTTSDLIATIDQALPVAVMMTAGVHTCECGMSVMAAARKMRSEDVHHLVVVDEAKTVIGILSVFDLLELLEDLEPGSETSD